MAQPSEKDVRSWVDASRDDLATARALLKSRRFLYVLFMCQQAIEKMLNACATVEIRPYTPNDFKEARPTNFLGHIIAEGKVVYKEGGFLLQERITAAGMVESVGTTRDVFIGESACSNLAKT